MTTSGANLPSEASLPDKDYLYGRYQTAEDERLRHKKKNNRLAEKLAHKSVDIPEDSDEMRLEANKTYNGIGTRGLVAVAAAVGLPPLLLAAVLGWSLLKSNHPHDPGSDTDTQYEFGAGEGGHLPWPLPNGIRPLPGGNE